MSHRDSFFPTLDTPAYLNFCLIAGGDTRLGNARAMATFAQHLGSLPHFAAVGVECQGQSPETRKWGAFSYGSKVMI